MLKYWKYNLNQIIALTEKNLKLALRFKWRFIFVLLTPMISLFIPIIIMNKFFDFNNQFGLWTRETFLIFQFLAYILYLLISLIKNYAKTIQNEKFWNTLPFLIISPINRLNLLISILVTRLILISFPFAFFIIICFIIYPISIITILSIIVIFFFIALIFSGFGLIIGVLVISKENLWRASEFMINIIFILSCITYPFEIFPAAIQNIIFLNPFYYIFDILRFTWVENNIILSIIAHPFHFFVLIISVITFPCIGLYFFNIIIKKFGIVGY